MRDIYPDPTCVCEFFQGLKLSAKTVGPFGKASPRTGHSVIPSTESAGRGHATAELMRATLSGHGLATSCTHGWQGGVFFSGCMAALPRSTGRGSIRKLCRVLEMQCLGSLSLACRLPWDGARHWWTRRWAAKSGSDLRGIPYVRVRGEGRSVGAVAPGHAGRCRDTCGSTAWTLGVQAIGKCHSREGKSVLQLGSCGDRRPDPLEC